MKCAECKYFHKLKHNFRRGKGFEETYCCDMLLHDPEAGEPWVQEVGENSMCEMFTPHRKAEWLEREVTQDVEDAIIPEWQVARCSVCGKYHTTPYMYFFTHFEYCPNCGAKMDEVVE